VNTLLLDKTGTITLGNRQATEFIALKGVDENALADAAQLSSLPMKLPRDARSSSLPRKNTASADVRSTSLQRTHNLFRLPRKRECPASTLTDVRYERAQ
jgi:high-affinity K+ transport system ATPase subunit B